MRKAVARRRASTLRVAVVIVLMFVAERPVPRAQTSADTILVNGHVVTVDKAFSIAEAIAIADGKFLAVGTNAAIRRTARPGTMVIELNGRTVIPELEDDPMS